MTVLKTAIFTIIAPGTVAIYIPFVMLYEEPALQRQFGESYRRYCEMVPRWIPCPTKLRP